MTVLYRKYRPQHFDDLIGQEAIRLTLLQALKSNNLSHAYLFSGPRGTGKTSTARLIARSIQCENRLPTGEACSTCDLCTSSLAGTLVDLVEIDAASNRGIDDIRDLREKIRFAPTRAKNKVYIVDEVHMLSKDAFNALLKTLEEPPAHVFFILATTELHKIPETIISRCQRYEFKRISELEIESHLLRVAEAEGLQVEPRALALLARSAEGGLRDALTLLDQFSGETVTEAVVLERLGLSAHASAQDLVRLIAQKDLGGALTLVEKTQREGRDLSVFTQAILRELREVIFRVATRAPLVHESDSLLHSLPLSELRRFVLLFDEAWSQLKRCALPGLPLEMALVECLHPSTSSNSVPAPMPNAPIAKMPAPTPTAPAVSPLATSSDPIAAAQALNPQDLLRDLAAQLPSPSVRSSLTTARLLRPAAGRFILCFSTQFHRDKVQAPAVMNVLQEAFKKRFDDFVDLRLELEAAPTESAGAPAHIGDLGWSLTEEPL